MTLRWQRPRKGFFALITGTPATIVAVLAIASIGFFMLQGRLPLRPAAVTVFGGFVIFGSSAIAVGLTQLVERAAAILRSTMMQL